MAAPHYQKLLELAHRRALDGKGGLAASMAELCLSAKSVLSERELELAFEILRLLVNQVEERIRQHISEYLAERDDVPRDLIDFLAKDDVTVAYPIILHSPLLDESDLLDIIVSRTSGHRQAIAVRPNLTTVLTDKLVEFEENEVMSTLLCNETADISEGSMRKMVEHSLDDESLREPLLHRDEMTPVLAQRMYIWVSDALRQFITANYEIDPETVEASVDRVMLDTFSSGANGTSSTATLNAPVDTEPAAPTHADDFAQGQSLLRYLDAGDMRGFQSAFAIELNLPQQAVGPILFDSGPETVAIACKACGVSKDVFAKIICHLAKTGSQETYRTSREYSHAVNYFERLDAAGASAVLARWRATPRTAWGG